MYGRACCAYEKEKGRVMRRIQGWPDWVTYQPRSMLDSLAVVGGCLSLLAFLPMPSPRPYLDLRKIIREAIGVPRGVPELVSSHAWETHALIHLSHGQYPCYDCGAAVRSCRLQEISWT